MADAAPSQSRFPWTEILLLFVLTLAAYGPGLCNGFVYDDEIYVLDNPLTKPPLKLWRMFSESFPPGGGDRGLYRPLVTLSYFLDGKAWGFTPYGTFNGFHFTNLLLHAFNASLLLLLLRRLGMDRWPAFLSALVFVVHPVLSESAAWITGRAELLGMSFGLVALLCFLHRQRGAPLVASLALWLMSMLCKEHWLVLPALAALVCFCIPNAPKFGRPAIIRYGIVSAVIAAVFWYMRFRAIGSWHPPVAAFGSVAAIQRIFTALAILWKYVGLWLWPMSLSVYHEEHIVTSAYEGGFIIATWIFVFWLMWRSRQYFPWLMLAMGWFWISILPVSNLVITIGAISAERFLYLPTLLFAPAIILAIRKALMVGLKERAWLPTAVILSILWCTALGLRLSWRVDDWATNLTLWEAASRCYPQSYGVNAQLAVSHFQEKDYAQAHVLAAEALAQGEKNPQPYQKYFTPKLREIASNSQACMAFVAYQKKFEVANEMARNFHYKEALDAYRKLVEDFPEQPQTHEALGDVYARVDNPMAARQQFEAALRLGSKSSALYAKYGKSLSDMDFKAEALLAYDQALRINPMNPIAHYYRGVVLTELEDFAGALIAFQSAIKISPKLPEPHLNTAGIFIHLKRYEEAKAEILLVLSVDPKNEMALQLITKLPKSTSRNSPR